MNITYISTKAIIPFKGNVISKGESFKAVMIDKGIVTLKNEFGTMYKVKYLTFDTCFKIKG